jgi:hypothetical protein
VAKREAGNIIFPAIKNKIFLVESMACSEWFEDHHDNALQFIRVANGG